METRSTPCARLADLDVGGGDVRLAGVINVSPESFYRGSVELAAPALAARGRALEQEGADLIDVGAMSTAPYLKTQIDEAEERRRMDWAVRILAAEVRVPISADTQRASVAAAALAAGARVINDVSGLAHDRAMADVAAQAEGVILMARETEPSDEEPIDLCRRLLDACLARAARAGIAPERIVLDPGIGFFRRARVPWDEFDLALLRGLDRLHELGRPLLVGISRKSFIGKLTGRAEVGQRLAGSLAATAIAVLHGADAVRTHDVGDTRDAVRIAAALRGGRR